MSRGFLKWSICCLDLKEAELVVVASEAAATPTSALGLFGLQLHIRKTTVVSAWATSKSELVGVEIFPAASAICMLLEMEMHQE